MVFFGHQLFKIVDHDMDTIPAAFFGRDTKVVRFLTNVLYKGHILCIVKFQHSQIEVDMRVPVLIVHNTANPSVMPLCIVIAPVEQIFVVFLILRHNHLRDCVHFLCKLFHKATGGKGSLKYSRCAVIFFCNLIIAFKYGIFHFIFLHANSIGSDSPCWQRDVQKEHRS